jgi:hypothetical protein
MPPFQWEDIDHSLVNLKLTDSAEDMHRKIKEDEGRIRFENRHNLNDNAVPSLVLRMEQEHADARAQEVYEIYCDAWLTQGHVKSADLCGRSLLERYGQPSEPELERLPPNSQDSHRSPVFLTRSAMPIC